MVVEVPLSKGKTTLIDRDDFERVTKHKWYLGSMGKGYAAHSVWQPGGKTKAIYLHRFILDAPPGMEVDHINGDPLDNTRKNLRLCTHKQNTYNQRVQTRVKASRFRGVRSSRGKRWIAQIRVDGKQMYLGIFECEEDAARVYDEAAKKYFGEFAYLNLKEVA